MNVLDQITIPTPCPADWDAMTGDDRIRFCGSCGKHVYNLSAMTSDEAIGVIRDRGGKLCAQLYRRPDGTVVTADCPEPGAATSRRQFSIRAMMAVIAGFGAAFGLAKLFAQDKPVASLGTPALPLRGEIACPPQGLGGAGSGGSEQP
jgi:hypothetical protein